MSLLRWFGRIFSLLTFLLSLSIVLVIALSIAWGIASWYKHNQNNQPQQWGLIWSTKETKAQDLTPENLDNLLSQIPFKKLQLMTYWDIHEPENTKYQFETLKTIFELAKGRNLKISLQLGLQQTPSSKCHQPEWTESLNPSQLQIELKNYIRQIISEFDQMINLEQYHLEPEISQTSNNNCPSQLTEKQFEELYRFLKTLTNKPIAVSRNNNSPAWKKEAIPADGYGLSFKPEIHLNEGNVITKNIPSGWYTFIAGNLKLFHSDANIFIRRIDLMKSSSHENLKQIFDYLRRTSIKTIYLQGAVVWLNDPDMFQAIKQQVEADF